MNTDREENLYTTALGLAAQQSAYWHPSTVVDNLERALTAPSLGAPV